MNNFDSLLSCLFGIFLLNKCLEFQDVYIDIPKFYIDIYLFMLCYFIYINILLSLCYLTMGHVQSTEDVKQSNKDSSQYTCTIKQM